LRFRILLTVCTTLEDVSCKLTKLAYFTQAKCFMHWLWIFRVGKWTQIQNYLPFHCISRGILYRGYKTSFHFRSLPTEIRLIISIETNGSFLAHLAFRPCELLSSLFVRRLSSVVRPSTFHILIFSSETTGPIATKLWWNGPWMAPFQICVQWSRFPTKMAAKLKIEKRGCNFNCPLLL
jgi:hypothetical protein